MAEVRLPCPGGVETWRTSVPGDFAAPDVAPNHSAFAAAHVVADPLAEVDPWLQPAIDWDATLAYRRQLWVHGLPVAEAMGTAQRGMGLGWDQAMAVRGLA